MTINDLAWLILQDTRNHFFLVDVALPAPDFKDEFAAHHSNHVSFGIFKPDFIEIHVEQSRENHRTIHWRVIDAKASRKVKISHQVQVGFYHLCIQTLLQTLDPPLSAALTFVENDAGEVWIPEPSIIPGDTPVPDQTFPIALLRPILESLLFVDLPRILSQDLPSVRWHYNPLCAGCDYSMRCRTETISGRTMSNIPHLSFGDHKFISQSLTYYRRLKNAAPITDLEDLHKLVHSGLVSDNGNSSFADSMPATAERLGMLMKLQGRISNVPISQCDLGESPVLKAATDGKVAMLGRRTLIFPRAEDIEVFISLGLDPNTEQLYAFSISVVESVNGQKRIVKEEDGVVAIGDEADFGSTFTARLASIIQDLLELKDMRVDDGIGTLAVQFYVFSRIEYEALVTLLVTQACRYDDGIEGNDSYVNARICIGGILDHSDVLLTSVQPELISSSLLFTIGSGKLRKNDLERYVRLFEGRGVSMKGQTVESLKERLKGLLDKVSPSGVAMGGKGGLARKLPKVVVVHEAIGALVAMPTPGYFQLDASKAILVDQQRCSSTDRPGGTVDESIEQAYKFWRENNAVGARERLRWRREAMRGVVYSLLERVELWCNAKGADVSSILPNSANDFVVAYIELVKNRHLKRLLFMRQVCVLPCSAMIMSL